MVHRHDGGHSARDHALAVLRVRNGALALALMPAALAVVLFAGGAPPGLRWPVAALAVLTLALAAAVAVVVARAHPPVTPTVAVPEHAAPALHGLIRELAERLDVPPPGGVALTPDCDSWLEEPPGRRPRGAPGQAAPVLVIGSPFLWWMRVAELRALLAPVVAGTGPSAHPDIAAARRAVRAWDATAALADGQPAARRPLLRLAGRASRAMLRAAGAHAGEMERAVAAAASARAQTVDYGLRIVAQEQVGLAYAGWDRLLTRVALPAWRTGRWPRRLDAGVVSALTELSRRDRLAEGFASRLGERPACDLLKEPGTVDEAISLLAARLFHGIPEGPAADWAPVDWPSYPEEVVDRIWRDRAARLFAALDAVETPTLACAVQRLAEAADGAGLAALTARLGAAAARAETAHAAPTGGAAGGGAPSPGLGGLGGAPMALPLQQARSGHDLLVEHVAAAVCCAAADTTGAAPGLDWLDGPVLLTGGRRRSDLSGPVHSLVDDGDPEPLRAWLAEAGVRCDKPVRLV
ncbi:hypothetical protein [Streptomyces sp. 6N223]|uniref:hypothetical protein n=1 Tax=Streptomyces sp. 6N223 TaxID=3457412 RepID=UPI003FCFD804